LASRARKSRLAQASRRPVEFALPEVKRAMRSRRHEVKHRDGEHRIGARGEEGYPPSLVFLLVGRRHNTQDLFLVGPDQTPDVYQHECPEPGTDPRSEEHTSELQSRGHLVCRLLLEKKKKELSLLDTQQSQSTVHTT